MWRRWCVTASRARCLPRMTPATKPKEPASLDHEGVEVLRGGCDVPATQPRVRGSASTISGAGVGSQSCDVHARGGDLTPSGVSDRVWRLRSAQHVKRPLLVGARGRRSRCVAKAPQSRLKGGAGGRGLGRGVGWRTRRGGRGRGDFGRACVLRLADAGDGAGEEPLNPPRHQSVRAGGVVLGGGRAESAVGVDPFQLLVRAFRVVALQPSEQTVHDREDVRRERAKWTT